MTKKKPYLEEEFYIGVGENKLRAIGMHAMEPRLSKNENEAIFGEHCCDLIFMEEGEQNHKLTISAVNRYSLFNMIFGHFREWVREILDRNPKERIFLRHEDGAFFETDFELALYVNDCITSSIQDKIDFAEEHGYRENWDSISISEIEPIISKKYKLELQSDFGQIQIFDDEFDSIDPPEWTKKANSDFACSKRGCLFFRVLENDDHAVPFQLLESEPTEEHDSYLHVVDAPFKTSGIFEIADQPIKVPRGTYVFRWYCSSAKKGTWKYQLKMWPSKIRKVTVLKKYNEEN